MYESYLVLTSQRIEVIRELENGMGKIHVKRPLNNIVKITAKKRHRDLITFKYGIPDGDSLIITGLVKAYHEINNKILKFFSSLDMDRFLIPNSQEATKTISKYILQQL